MANYMSTTRTNYFKVTDEEKYEKLFSMLCSEDNIRDFTEKREDGIYHGFGAYGDISCYNEELDEFTDEFYDGLKDILPDGEAFIMISSGYEKLRYVSGFATIVTNDGIEVISLEEAAKKKAGEMLGLDGPFQTQIEY